MTRQLATALAATAILAIAPAAAHHSFSAQFDIDQPVTITGPIAEMRWSNPHAWVYVDVKGTDGTIVKWAVETGAANQLYRRGWRRDDLVAGTVVTVDGWRARNGSPTMNASSIKLPDGRLLFDGVAPGKSGER